MIQNQDTRKQDQGQMPWRVGVVSYLNSRPLICDLQRDPSVRLFYDVPSRLTDRLLRGEFDVSLIPVIDLLRPESRLEIVSNACIACDGETLTVRVFSKVPPDRIRRVYVDLDSHTSLALARILWGDLYGTSVEFIDLDPTLDFGDCESVLLIGDKVVGVESRRFRYQVDLGGAWKTRTGLPFVFAVWAAPQGCWNSQLAEILDTARDRGVKKLAELAVEYGPSLNWPVALAQQYFQHYLNFGMTERHVEGMVRFLDLARSRCDTILGRAAGAT